MTKPLLFLISVLFSSHISFAQKIRFTDTTNKWQVLRYYASHPSSAQHLYDVYKYYYSGTKTINSYTYSALIEGTHIAGYIREDTLVNKVYIRRPGDTTERILFNFNANIGDTVSPYVLSVVKSIDSVNINNYWHKRFYTTSTDYIIEGIGCLYDLVIPVYFKTYYKYTLICFSNNNTTPVTNPILFDRCRDTVLTVNKISNDNKLIIYPQPANDLVTIYLPVTINDGQVSLYNSTGQLVYRQQYWNKKELTIKNEHWQGIYFYQVTNTSNNASFRGRIIFR